MTPVPFTKTPVNVALAPAVMVAGFATKLEMEGTGGGGGGVLDEPPQPIKPPKHTLSATAHATGARIRFIVFPVYSKVGRISSFTSYDPILTTRGLG
jgi:hypothetical protein